MDIGWVGSARRLEAERCGISGCKEVGSGREVGTSSLLDADQKSWRSKGFLVAGMRVGRKVEVQVRMEGLK